MLRCDFSFDLMAEKFVKNCLGLDSSYCWLVCLVAEKLRMTG